MSDLLPTPDESLDRLSRTLNILQRKRGHRATSDDVLLAYFAAQACPYAKRALDLGTGKGTVALLLARALAPSLERLVGLEAQPESFALAVRNARLNQLDSLFEPRFADLRASAAALHGETFDLITGAPPFMPLGTGVLPQDPQRASGRFELRGGVEDYAKAAVRHLAPGGRVVLLMDGAGQTRLINACNHNGLGILQLTGVAPRPGRPETFWVAIAAQGPAAPPEPLILSMRDAHGESFSQSYLQIRERLDLP